MKIVNVAELEGETLNWAVAKSDEEHPTIGNYGAVWLTKNSLIGNYRVISVPFSPSTDWIQGGRLIESAGIGLQKLSNGWMAATDEMDFATYEATHGPTPLIAACRAIVAAKFGDTVEVPEELL